MKQVKAVIVATLVIVVAAAGMAWAQPGTVTMVSGDLVAVQLEKGIGARFEAGTKIKLDKKSGQVTAVDGDVVTMDLNRGKASEFSVGQAIDLRKKPVPGAELLEGC